MGDLAGSPYVDSAAGLGDRTRGAGEKWKKRGVSKPHPCWKAPSLASWSAL